MQLDRGDRVVFRIIDGRAVLARTPDLLELAEVVPVPADERELDWSAVRERATRSQVARSI